MIAGPNSTRRALNQRARVLLKPTANSTTSSCRLRSIPRDYLAAGHLEHGYAHTSYGVQGATHRNARYVPTEESSFEEGYVAVTRGRESTRIYLVDGQTYDAEADTAHAPGEVVATGLSDIAGSLGRRRANAMAADLVPGLTRVGELQRSMTLPELRRRRHELEAILATAPPDPTRVIADTQAALDTERARQHVAGLAGIRRMVARGPELRHPAVCRAARAETRWPPIRRAERERWLAQHPGIEGAIRDFARAERSEVVREQARSMVQPAQETVDRIGPEPARQRERALWRRELESHIESAGSAGRHGSASPHREKLKRPNASSPEPR